MIRPAETTDLGSEVEQWISGQGPRGSALRADPVPLYHRLLEEDPVHHARTGTWLLVRRADVDAAGRHPALSRETAPWGLKPPAEDKVSPWARLTHGNLEFRDPPEHTRLRSLAQQPFSARNIARWRPRLQDLIESCLDELEPTGSMDLVRDFALPFPVAVITELLGLPDELSGILDGITEVLFELFVPGPKPPSVMERADGLAVEYTDALGEVIRHRRSNLGDDLLSMLIQARDGTDALTLDELTATCMLLHIAGHETTGNLISNAVLTLLRHPDQLREVQADPDLIRPALEEVLRFEPSAITAAPATATEDVCFSDSTIPAGEMVQPLTAAANRDPRAFPDPDRFDIHRAPNRHVAFSSGVHFCMGATLSRAEAEDSLRALLRRLPGLSMTSSAPRWRPVWSVRALEELPIAWDVT
jgi:cytochrome P450